MQAKGFNNDSSAKRVSLAYSNNNRSDYYSIPVEIIGDPSGFLVAIWRLQLYEL